MPDYPHNRPGVSRAQSEVFRHDVQTRTNRVTGDRRDVHQRQVDLDRMFNQLLYTLIVLVTLFLVLMWVQ